MLGTGFNKRSCHATHALKSLHDNGCLNDLEAIHISNCSVWSNTGIAGNWFVSNPELAGGGVLIETGSHLLDQTSYALDLEFDTVQEFQMASLAGYAETEAKGKASVIFDNRRIPLSYRFSVRHNTMNGIFLKVRQGYIRCDTGFSGNLCFLNDRFQKVFDFAIRTSGAHTVEAAANAMAGFQREI